MPNHIHVLLTPLTSLEKAVQFIKGGFSFRAKKELGSNMEVWQKGFQDHRIRDAADYREHVRYIQENPVKARLCGRAAEFPFSSAHSGFELDTAPQGLKPGSFLAGDGAAEAAPLQNSDVGDDGRRSLDERPQGLKPGSFLMRDGAAEAAPLQSKTVQGRKAG